MYQDNRKNSDIFFITKSKWFQKKTTKKLLNLISITQIRYSLSDNIFLSNKGVSAKIRLVLRCTVNLYQKKKQYAKKMYTNLFKANTSLILFWSDKTKKDISTNAVSLNYKRSFVCLFVASLFCFLAYPLNLVKDVVAIPQVNNIWPALVKTVFVLASKNLNTSVFQTSSICSKKGLNKRSLIKMFPAQKEFSYFTYNFFIEFKKKVIKRVLAANIKSEFSVLMLCFYTNKKKQTQVFTVLKVLYILKQSFLHKSGNKPSFFFSAVNSLLKKISGVKNSISTVNFSCKLTLNTNTIDLFNTVVKNQFLSGLPHSLKALSKNQDSSVLPCLGNDFSTLVVERANSQSVVKEFKKNFKKKKALWFFKKKKKDLYNQDPCIAQKINNYGFFDQSIKIYDKNLENKVPNFSLNYGLSSTNIRIKVSSSLCRNVSQPNLLTGPSYLFLYVLMYKKVKKNSFIVSQRLFNGLRVAPTSWFFNLNTCNGLKKQKNYKNVNSLDWFKFFNNSRSKVVILFKRKINKLK